MNPDGSACPAFAPLTGAAAADGEFGAEIIDLILAALKAIPGEHHADAEAKLVDLARRAGAEEVSDAATHLVGLLNPDGDEPDDADPLPAPERELWFRKKRDGRWAMELTADDATGQQIEAVIDAMSQRRTGDDGPDTRHLPQRRADGLVDVFDLAMNSPDLPMQAGERVHVTVGVSFDALKSGLGEATFDINTMITAEQARVYACDCLIIPATLNAKSEPMELGRARRLISNGQRRALYLRDRGCAFPGCKRPPKHCQGHHILYWQQGGKTNLGNLVLLCGYHHRLIHNSQWEVRIAADGLPEFLPPTWKDPNRKPRRNTLHPPIAIPA